MKLSLIIITAAVLYTPNITLAASPITSVHDKDVLDAGNQIMKRATQCPKRPVNVNCFRNPCDPNPCGETRRCCADYSKGCDYFCINK